MTGTASTPEGVLQDQSTIRAGIADADELYARKGFGGRVGFGEHPALLVIDLVVGWTDPDRPLGGQLADVVANTKVLLDEFRARDLPVFFTTMAYEPHLQDAGLIIRKSPALHDAILGTESVEVHPDLAPTENETVIVKKYPSAFFGTPLASTLTALGVDTAIVTGCSTSACVRATALDALCYGFRPILPRECVGDRAAGPHEWNLFDIDAKFGDVEDLANVIEHVGKVVPRPVP